MVAFLTLQSYHRNSFMYSDKKENKFQNDGVDKKFLNLYIYFKDRFVE